MYTLQISTEQKKHYFMLQQSNSPFAINNQRIHGITTRFMSSTAS